MAPQQISELQRFFDRTSFAQIILTYIGMVFLFAGIFLFLSTIPGQGIAYHDGTPIGLDGTFLSKFFDALYFSVVTATSTGYGDILPHGLSRLFATVEVIGALLTVGLIISKFVSVKQETILEEVYEISFDERINRLRSALYLYRTDTNRLLERIKSGAMVQREIDDLWTHFMSFDVTLADIGKIIIQEKIKKEHTKTIDPFTLELLLNSVDLSLNKTYALVSLLVSHSKGWKKELALRHLESIVKTTRRVITHGNTKKMLSKTSRKKLAEMTQIVGALEAVIMGRAQPIGLRNLQDYEVKR